jgi:NADH-ubiquinone oxidoreductase chain 5
MYLTLLSLPFLSYFTTNCLGRFIGFKGSSFIAPVSVALTFGLSILAFFETTIYSSPCLVYLSVWFSGELLMSNWSFLFDSLASLMLLVITGVSCLVHLYSTEYMANDPYLARFLGYLSLFTFFMLLLVTADNFIVMFLG